MKINWTVRARNPIFWVQILAAVIVPVLGYFGLTGADITTWVMLWRTLWAAICNPYVVFLVMVSVWNAINDPTTKGVGDAKHVMEYDSPK